MFYKNKSNLILNQSRINFKLIYFSSLKILYVNYKYLILY